MRKVFKLKSEGCAVGDTLNTGAQKKKKKIAHARDGSHRRQPC